MKGSSLNSKQYMVIPRAHTSALTPEKGWSKSLTDSGDLNAYVPLEESISSLSLGKYYASPKSIIFNDPLEDLTIF